MKRFIAWVNRVFTHVRDKEHDFGFRALIHIPVGFVMGLFDWSNGLARLFEFYEKNEDRHTGDQAWKDTFGAMVGWVIGRLVLVGFLAWGIITLIHFVKSLL